MADLKLAVQGDEEELSKMVAACMHLTMVLEQREDIKQATMKGLSVDDQLVVKKYNSGTNLEECCAVFYEIRIFNK